MIVIIDYQMGNLRSVQKAFERVGHKAVVTSDPAEIVSASHVVLPGVGAFADAMTELQRRELVAPIRAVIDANRPFLGICLGLQLLFDTSYEDGEYQGFGIIPGQVRRFELPVGYKVPHMGWNEISLLRRPPIFAGIEDQSHFYFVHSYYVIPDDKSLVAGEATYGEPFCSMIWRDNLFATQFHPEKSQQNGLRVLKNFAQLAA